MAKKARLSLHPLSFKEAVRALVQPLKKDRGDTKSPDPESDEAKPENAARQTRDDDSSDS